MKNKKWKWQRKNGNGNDKGIMKYIINIYINIKFITFFDKKNYIYNYYQKTINWILNSQNFHLFLLELLVIINYYFFVPFSSEHILHAVRFDSFLKEQT